MTFAADYSAGDLFAVGEFYSDYVGGPEVEVVVGDVTYADSPFAIGTPAYVAGDAQMNVTVIDGWTLDTVLVAVGDTPVALAVNPVTNRIYVASFWSGRVTVINGATNDTLSVGAGNWPYAVAVNQFANKVLSAMRAGFGGHREKKPR